MTYPVSVKLFNNPSEDLSLDEIQKILNANARLIELISLCDSQGNLEERQRLLYFLKKNLDFLTKAAKGELDEY